LQLAVTRRKSVKNRVIFLLVAVGKVKFTEEKIGPAQTAYCRGYAEGLATINAWLATFSFVPTKGNQGFGKHDMQRCQRTTKNGLDIDFFNCKHLARNVESSEEQA
jgi:hypothetical protein